MAALKLLSICLLLILVTINIGDVRAKCTPIALTVKAEFSESSLRSDYKHTRLVTSSSSFRRNFDRLDVSASVSGSYAGFSAEASASFSEVSESAASSTKSRDETKTSKVTYAPGQNHIIRKLSKTVTIDGRSASVITQDFVDVIAVEDSPSYSQLRKMGEDYIAYNYGGIRGGKIRNNVYTASACVTGYVGQWIRQSDGRKIECSLQSRTTVRCVFKGASRNNDEIYHINGAKITWTKKKNIFGTYNGEDTITWTSGNTWKKIE